MAIVPDVNNKPTSTSVDIGSPTTKSVVILNCIIGGSSFIPTCANSTENEFSAFKMEEEIE